MIYRTIKVERQGPVAILALDRPDQGNAISRLMMAELDHACDQFEADDAARVLVIAGDSSVFSNGWDAEFITGQDAPSDFAMVSGLTKPVVAAVTGAALSAGLELALACDIRIASESAEFAFPEVEFGLVPMAGGMQRLSRTVGRAKALEMVLLSERLTARDALVCGLVSKVVNDDELIPSALSLAQRIAEQGPLAVQYAKEAVVRGIEMPLEQALQYETDLTVILQTTEDRSEGVKAFLEKREPKFKGR
jgi:enoyl-CoA hydratase